MGIYIFVLSLLFELIQSLRAFRRAGKMEEGRRKKEKGRRKREEGSGLRKCREAPRRHQGGTEEAQSIYIDSNAKTGT